MPAMKKQYPSKRQSSLRASSHGVRANKRLGQHFLTDSGMIARIVDAIDPDEGQQLLEIGPGLGAITLPVLARCQRLYAIEIDRRVIPILREKAQPLGELELIEEDVLSVDYPQLLGRGDRGDWRVFGNLPYNLSTPILFALVAQTAIKDMMFMLQKEVVERMTALPGDKHYGRLSIMLAYHHDVYPLFDVPPECFSPPPKVMSAMVGLSRLAQPRWQVDDAALFAQVVKQAFSMRRKTLRNTLKPLISGEALVALDIDPSQRAEVIDGEAFARIANFLSSKTR